MKRSHKMLFLTAILLTVTSWAVAITFWDKLPVRIPTHFNFVGKADGWVDKSLLAVFMLPALQTAFLGLMGFLYKYPQYSDIPTSMWLMTLDKKHRNHAFDLIRTMIVGIAVWLGVLFTYLTYASNDAAVSGSGGISSFVLVLIICLMLAWLFYWAIKVYKVTKDVINSKKKEL